MSARLVLIIGITLFTRNVILASLFAMCIILEYAIRKSVTMQFTLSTKAFKANLNKVFIDKKPVLPVLSCVKIEALSGKVFMESVDLRYATYIRVEQGARVELGGIAVIPLKALKDFVKAQKSEMLTFTLIDGKMHIEGTGNITIKVSTDSFPVWPDFTVESSAWSQNSFTDNYSPMLKRVVEHCATNEARPILHAVNVEIESGKVIFSATDAYALATAYVNADTYHESDMNRPILENGFVGNIPYPPARHIAKFESLCLIQTGYIKGLGESLRLVGGNVEVIQNCYTGRYPDYRAIIARVHTYTLPVSRLELLNALKGLKSAANLSVKLVKFPTVLRCIVKRDEQESYVDVPCVTPSGNTMGNLIFDICHLIRMLESITDDEVNLLTHGSTSPLQIDSYRQTNILMPQYNR